MGGAGSNGTVYRLVFHCTVSPCRRGQAWATAQQFANPASRGSAHWSVDPGEIVQSVPEDRYAWHSPPNQHSLGWEFCDPVVYSGTNRELPPERWGDAAHDAMLRLGASHMRQVADRHGIPLRWLTVAQVRNNERGFCDHHDVAQAFGQSTHWDAGVGFHQYRDRFMGYVTGGSPPQPRKERDMYLLGQRERGIWLIGGPGGAYHLGPQQWQQIHDYYALPGIIGVTEVPAGGAGPAAHIVMCSAFQGIEPGFVIQRALDAGDPLPKGPMDESSLPESLRAPRNPDGTVFYPAEQVAALSQSAPEPNPAVPSLADILHDE